MSFFLASARTQKNPFQSTEQIVEWFETQKKAYRFNVKQIPFNELDLWSFEPETKDLVHRSGKFFRIQGLWANNNINGFQEWTQPILNQPEVGILGIITKVIGGIRYFLMQAKMEPGNIGTLQLSPTVQATRSNYTQVHHGVLPKYLEYFRDLSKTKMLVDQLQSEHGTRFLRKRNRNMIVEVSGDVALHDDFRWLTLGQIKELIKRPNFVNMNSKSVIASSMLLLEDQAPGDKTPESFGKAVLASAFNKTAAQHTIDDIVSWLAELKSKYEIQTRYLPLKDIGWEKSDTEIFHPEKRFFSVIAVSVEAGSREISKWTQPLIKSHRTGLIGFVGKKFDGVLHFLVQALVEPGAMDVVELGPTVSSHEAARVPFADLFLDPGGGKVVHSSLQSIEGGRFFQNQNRYMIVELEENKNVEIPENYKWMTLNQLLAFMRYTSSVHIEARELLACMPLVDSPAEQP